MYIRDQVHEVLDGSSEGSLASCVRLGIQSLILLNVAAVVLETVRPIGQQYAGALSAFETFSVAVFSVEYALRLWVCVADPRYDRAVVGRLRYAMTPLSLIDLFAVLPAYLPLFGVDLRSLRAVRLMRTFRLLKLARYSTAVQRLGNALRNSSGEIGVTLFAAAIVLTLASSVLYYAERNAQPDVFSSIPAAAWWGIATLTTVGYGDMAPVTAIGRLAAAVVAVLGVGIIALPAGILASAFAENQEYQEQACPHCGATLSRSTTPEKKQE